MAKRGGGDGFNGLGFLLVAGAAALGLVYLQTGRGKTNALLIPDALEDPIDRVIAALNRTFGHRWVNVGLNVLQAEIQRAMPGVAALLSAVYRVEQAYGNAPMAGGAKKEAVRRLIRV